MRLLLLLAVATPLLAACGNTPAEPAGGRPPTATGGGSGPAVPPTRPTSPPAPAPTGCAGVRTVTVRPGERPGPVCLPAGAELRIVTGESRLQPWTPLTSSDDSVLRCVSRGTGNGAVEATCTAVRPGTVLVSTGTAPFPGDPHGPPQETWQLPVTVTG